LVKHNGPLVDAEGNPHGVYRQRGLPDAIVEYAEMHDLKLHLFASAEAQVASISDDIAYNAHDVDDGLRAGLFGVIDLGDVPLAGEALSAVLRQWPGIDTQRTVHETVRRVISDMIADVIAETRRRAADGGLGSADDVRNLGRQLVGFSPQMREKNKNLQSFLTGKMYRHPQVTEIMARAQRVVRDLFGAYLGDPALLPDNWREGSFTDDRSRFARQVCDFIAGMTDRFALDQHKRLFDLDPLFR
jgi:dGTPase